MVVYNTPNTWADGDSLTGVNFSQETANVQYLHEKAGDPRILGALQPAGGIVLCDGIVYVSTFNHFMVFNEVLHWWFNLEIRENRSTSQTLIIDSPIEMNLPSGAEVGYAYYKSHDDATWDILATRWNNATKRVQFSLSGLGNYNPGNVHVGDVFSGYVSMGGLV